MKISVVTISYNQATFLKSCIDSVFSQNYPDVEHIVVDPGSTDGSREIIEAYGPKIKKVFEKDLGPADGLNKGFAQATGDIFCFLNSDDVFLPDAFNHIVNGFRRAKADVLYGHGIVIDQFGNKTRNVYSDGFSLSASAYGACILIQPSVFFTRAAYLKSGGFNIDNRSNWDGELFIDMGLAGARFKRVNESLSAYRVYGESITGSGKFAAAHQVHAKKMYEKISGRKYEERSPILEQWYKYKRKIVNFRDTYERLIRGPIFMSGK